MGSRDFWKNEMPERLLEYIVQTRSEIDTEKRERDQILNFIVATLGGLAFATLYRISVAPIDLTLFQRNPKPVFWVSAGAMAFIFGLFVVRREKLGQIADRWFSLQHVLKDAFGEANANVVSFLLETHVCKQHCTSSGLWPPRYLRKDVLLDMPVLAIIYGLQAMVTWSQMPLWNVGLAMLTLFAAAWLHWSPLRDPWTDG